MQTIPDSRGYFPLPPPSEGASYYVYGTPGSGLGQFAHPRLLTFLFLLERRWAAADARKIGVGNISLAGGAPFPPHLGHRQGLEVDLRPLRTDGKPVPVRWTDRAYDRAGTQKLVQLMWQTGMVAGVLFNDVHVPGVAPFPGHDDRLHVEVLP